MNTHTHTHTHSHTHALSDTTEPGLGGGLVPGQGDDVDCVLSLLDPPPAAQAMLLSDPRQQEVSLP